MSRARSTWPVAAFASALLAVSLAGLGILWAAAPGRSDLLAAAATGAAFGGCAGTGGYAAVVRAAAGSIHKGVQVFLAVTTVKVIAFAAFLLTIALTTSLHPAALAGGLVGTTLAGEILVISSLRRLQGPPPGEGIGGRG